MFSGHLNAQVKKTVGILDLGGGSTQITFLPKLRVCGLIARLQMSLQIKTSSLVVTNLLCLLYYITENH